MTTTPPTATVTPFVHEDCAITLTFTVPGQPPVVVTLDRAGWRRLVHEVRDLEYESEWRYRLTEAVAALTEAAAPLPDVLV